MSDAPRERDHCGASTEGEPNHRLASRRPEASEFSSDYHRKLIDRVEGNCAIKVLRDQLIWICELSSNLSTDQVDTVHEPYRWSVRQVMEHVADAERVFGYRMLRLADGSQPELSGWDENVSADSRFGLGNFSLLVTELGDLRKANLGLLARLVPNAWDARGKADRQVITVRTLAWLAAGHLQHHFEIIEKRCGITAIRTQSMLE